MDPIPGDKAPLSVVIYNEALDVWNSGAYIGTFRGNQMAMAAGLATLKYIKEHRIPDHITARGEQLMGRLNVLKQQAGCIGDVHGRGLMIGVEIVDDRQPVDPLGHHPVYKQW
ncbi:aminotransferase class III-fold pyridoxal phosphate-dependent enzyme [Paenibacillus sp. NPDC055715]